jgi:hypothetical protein
MYHSGEVEPTIAVNPRNPRNIVAAWQQDRFPEGYGALTNLVATSFDGGRTFRRVLVPGLTVCTGGVFDRATDPWLSFGGDGAVYLASMTIVSSTPITTGIVVNRSTDGGRTWSEPVVVAAQDYTNDKEQITAHPRDPGRAYVTWSKVVPYSLDPTGTVYATGNALLVSRTEDAGATWSVPRPVFAGALYAIPLDADIHVLRDGALVCVFQVWNPSDQVFPEGAEVPIVVMASRSEDDGQTWSPPVVIGETDESGTGERDGAGGVNHPSAPSSDMGRDGALYVTWPDTHEGSSRILWSRSDEGGVSWTEPAAAATVPAQAFTPTIAVAGDGSVGITFYDFRRDRRGDTPLSTDLWFLRSRDRGAHWRQTHLAGPFDLRSAPSKSDRRFVGDYAGLAGLPRGFVAAFGLARPLARIGPSDIFVAVLSAR